LTRARRLGTHRCAGARRRSLSGHGRALLLGQFGDEIGPRRHDGPGNGLAGERTIALLLAPLRILVSLLGRALLLRRSGTLRARL
jgi:hypothetical protein